jgi:hypothetical protein
MRVLHPTEGLAQPNICLLCESTPSPTTQRVVDTERTMVSPTGADVVWHKYVCESCGLEIANKLGLISNEQAKAAFHAAQAATARLDDVRQKVQSAAEDIVAFAKDVVLGNERAAVDKWLIGDFKENVEKVSKTVSGQRKQATGSDVVGNATTPESLKPTVNS